MINEAQTLKGHLIERPQGAANSFNNYFDGLDSTTSEDVTRLGDLPVPKKIPSPRAGGSSSSPKLVDQFPALSADPSRKRSIVMSISEDARVLSSPVGISSYLRCLVIEKDQAKMNEVEVPCLFNEAQQALNRDELEAARKEYADLVEHVKRVFEVSDDETDTVANDPNLYVQKKLDQIEQLQVEVDLIKAEAGEWKKNMDRLASENETARAEFASAEVQLQAAKEKTSAQAKKLEELQSQLNLAIFGQENLAKELEAAKLEVVVFRAEADDRVAQHKADAEVARDQARNMVKHANWQSRREALDRVYARDFDLLAEN
ncbi:uncharacterized protein [Nicotiana tomentosiformis]|uniref:uncharacterized protein n=1 Tax=Nicotiana tomentosiformis TaxID=4098 RepID=UPI00388C62E3